MKETVGLSDEIREDQWGVRSIDKVQHTVGYGDLAPSVRHIGLDRISTSADPCRNGGTYLILMIVQLYHWLELFSNMMRVAEEDIYLRKKLVM